MSLVYVSGADFGLKLNDGMLFTEDNAPSELCLVNKMHKVGPAKNI